MLLNYEEIKEKNIFQKDSYCDDNFKDANYDLRIGEFISIGEDKPMNPDGSIDLKPRGMIVAVTEEIFNTPNNVIGYTTLKNRLSLKGIMAINVGIIDPQFQGPISSALINFGMQTIRLEKGERFLRTTFHTFNVPTNPKTTPSVFTKKTYLQDRGSDAKKYLDKTFLNMKTIYEDVINEVDKKQKNDDEKFYRKLTSLGVIIGACSLGIAIIAILINCFISEDKSASTLESRMDSLEEQFYFEKGVNTLDHPNGKKTYDQKQK